MKREPGYYWVLTNRDWVVAQYAYGKWYTIGNSYDTLEDKDFETINETRITAPDEQQG